MSNSRELPQTAPLVFALGLAAIVFGTLLTAWGDPVSSHFCQGAVLALAAVLGAWVAVTGRIIRVHWPVLVAAAAPCMIGLAQIALGKTVVPHETAGAVTAWAARAAAFLLAACAFDARRRRFFLTGLVWFGAMLSVVGVLQWFTGGGKVFWIIPTDYSEGVIGPFLNRDHYAVFVELILPVALWRALTGARLDLRYAAAAAVLFGSVVVSGSRTGIAIAVVEVIALVGAARLRTGVSRTAIAAACLLIAVSSVVGGWHYAWERFHQGDQFRNRRYMLAATVQMIRERPATGFGLGTWPTVYPAYAVFDPPGVYMNHAHNDWAEWTAEGGFAMTAVMLLFGLAAARMALRHPWCAGVVAILIHAGMDFPMQKPSLALLAMALLGAAASADVVQPRSRVNNSTSTAKAASAIP